MPSFLETLGSMFSGAVGAQDGVHLRVWNELRPWVGNLVPAATRKWLPRIAGGVICEVPLMKRGEKVGDCEHFGVAACDVCYKPVCLDHSRIDQHGDAICYVCVADAVHTVPPVQRERARQQHGNATPPPRERRQAPPPSQGPSPEQVNAWLKVLGMKPGAKWDAVRVAHRKLSAQHHPDKAKGARAKTVAEARYKEVQVAFNALKGVYPEAA